jgi:hypothetical protein
MVASVARPASDPHSGHGQASLAVSVLVPGMAAPFWFVLVEMERQRRERGRDSDGSRSTL